GAPARLAYRRAGYCLPPAPTASAHPTRFISRLVTQPVLTPINAPPTASRLSAYDPGPRWLARPSTYGSSIHNTFARSLALTGARSHGLHTRCLRFVTRVTS